MSVESSDGVFPAPAGINRPVLVPDDLNARVPRASGDKPAIGGEWIHPHMCSPRQRG
ncbi:hypothetical protein H9U08_002027 [Salmonella enterica]|nr:hypothetical protein [Salmonella enterica]